MKSLGPGFSTPTHDTSTCHRHTITMYQTQYNGCVRACLCDNVLLVCAGAPRLQWSTDTCVAPPVARPHGGHIAWYRTRRTHPVSALDVLVADRELDLLLGLHLSSEWSPTRRNETRRVSQKKARCSLEDSVDGK
jgi:hypothetical protein